MATNFWYLLPGLLVGSGIVITLYGFKVLKTAKRSAAWPFVIGVITSSKITENWDEGSGTSYGLKIEYSYAVEDKLFTGNLIAFGMRYWRESLPFATNYTQRYQVEKKVRVFYDPMNPLQSVLEPGAWIGSYRYIAFGAFEALFGLFGFYVLHNAQFHIY